MYKNSLSSGHCQQKEIYRKVSNIRCIKFQNLRFSRPALQLVVLAQSIEAMY